MTVRERLFSGGHSGGAVRRRRRKRGQASQPSRRPAPDIGAVLLQSSAARWQAFASQVARSRRRASEEAIHDLRVATRRLIATLDILKTILPGSSTPRLRRQLKRHLRAFRDLRDLQVQMIRVRRVARRFPALGPLSGILRDRERELLTRAQREIAGMRLQAMERALAAAESHLEDLLADSLMRQAARTIALGALARRFSRAATLKGDALSGATARIHRFRIAFKQFRYAVEALQAVLPGVDRAMLKAMDRYQTRMGEIQDIEVLLGSVNSFARGRSRSAPVQFLHLKEYLMARRRVLIEKFIAGADDLDGFWVRIAPPASPEV